MPGVMRKHFLRSLMKILSNIPGKAQSCCKIRYKRCKEKFQRKLACSRLSGFLKSKVNKQPCLWMCRKSDLINRWLLKRNWKVKIRNLRSMYLNQITVHNIKLKYNKMMFKMNNLEIACDSSFQVTSCLIQQILSANLPSPPKASQSKSIWRRTRLVGRERPPSYSRMKM